MMLDLSMFDYLKPTDKQRYEMDEARSAARRYATVIDTLVPDGPDKTYILRTLRTVAMWVNVAITRETSGMPRQDVNVRDYPADHPVQGDLGSIPL